MLPIWQTIADHFYPIRADFQVERSIGTEFADHLVDSQPLLLARDLGNSLHAMLRDGEWFELGTDGAEPDHRAKIWLEWAAKRQRNMMESKTSGFIRACKQGDHDYTNFGQTVISVELNKQRNGYLYRNWHLRDVAWRDDESGNVCEVVRKWDPTNRDLKSTFGDQVHPKVTEALGRNRHFDKVRCRHYVLPSDLYGDERFMQYPYVSVYLDCENNHIMQEVGLRYKYYVIPRFQTVSGSPYAYSMATVVALPNARMLQAMTHTLLEAAERLARPPIIATEKAVRSDIDLGPDGITWVDKDYDERLGDALQTLRNPGGLHGWPVGDAARTDVVEILRSSFFINKISLPSADHTMTATEVAERMKQFRRENLPLFAPIEEEYNGQLCETTFDLGMASGFFGSTYDIPESLQGRETTFKFMSPLSATEGEEKMVLFSQVSQILRESAELDPGVKHNADFDRAFRDAVDGVGAPANWLVDPEVAIQRRQQDALAQAAQMAMGQAQ